MEYYSEFFKKKDLELLIHAGTQVNLRNVTLSESSQTQNSTYGRIPFPCNARQGKGIYSDK